MLFNSIQFGIFFSIVYFLYILAEHKTQNKLLLIASYIFYGAWDWRFLFLIFVSTVVDFNCGLIMGKTISYQKRKIPLFISIFVNLLLLGFFKYFNFFSNSFYSLLSLFGITGIKNWNLSIILPIGISFYTFQTMSYTIDVYNKDIKPTNNFWDFALYVSFFPQLVAGPIERATNLLPQILTKREITIEKIKQGSWLVLYGLFQKMFIADNLARIVDPVFASSSPYNGVQVLLAVYAFAFQIYCDFAGYSNIARGISKLMGFHLMINFSLPYFSKKPSEFWKRWHISLSSWLRDYLYIPLGGNRNGNYKTYRNLLITMILGGLWHGAAWNFIIWGLYQGFILIIERLLNYFNIPKFQFLKKKNMLISIFEIFIFFNITCIGWIFFRAQSFDQIYYMLHSLLFNFKYPYGLQIEKMIIKMLFYIVPLIVFQVIHYQLGKIEKFTNFNYIKISIISAVMLYLISIYSSLSHQFIYFQF